MYVSAKQKRIKRQKLIWGTVIFILATPVLLAVLLATILGAAGCANPGIVCNLPF